MFKILKIFISFSVLIFTGCNSLVESINGESKPQRENYESLKRFVDENQINIDLDRTFFFDSNIGIELLYNFKPYNIQRVSNPDIYLFDHENFLIDDSLLGGCVYERPAPDGQDFYTAIYNINLKLTHHNNINNLEGKLINYKGEMAFPKKSSEGSRIMFIVWSKYKGKKFIKSHIDYTLKTLRYSPEKLDVYFLNVDYYSYQ